MADSTDTIAAIATPAGRGGIAVLRLSGPACVSIAAELTGTVPESRHAHFVAFRDSRAEVIDRGLMLYFPAPASYTGEDVLELHGHGGRTLPRLLLARTLELGARHAEPGEFSRRAFLNDKLDLVQAEAVADIVDSGSRQAARSAMRSLEGDFSRKIDAVVESLIRLRVDVEGALDFPEEELELLETGGLKQGLVECLEQLRRLLENAERGGRLREGLRIVILGRPNVGKSSLLNCLSRSERAIVTSVPGTTRDLIEEQITVGGLTVNMVDTAGIRETGDVIEREGIDRALNAAATADVILMMRDAGETRDTALPEEQMQRLHGAGEVIIINNKIDLAGEEASLQYDAEGRPVIGLSATTGAGVELLTDRLLELGGGEDDQDVILARGRHMDALRRAVSLLEQSLVRLEEHITLELLAEDLRVAQSTLGEITGEVAVDDLLGEIFSRFCIGK
ncbi:MAG: tRNA uridine-5-carboxymethylaminomethyl(34) synthesis GTPase MnmE [Gammaproteobacteria bacterium]